MNEDNKKIDTNATGTESSALLDQLVKKALNQQAVTSNTTGFEERIGAALSGVDEAKKATEERINSEFEREKNYDVNQLNARRTNAQESRRGFGTQKVALKLLEESNIKYINDLESRKQEALLANDAQAAQQISGLQIKAMTFEQNAKQQTFANLLGLAGLQSQISAQKSSENIARKQLELQRTSEARLGKAQTFVEQQAMGAIALQYGVNVEDGDTFEDVINKAKPFASKEQKTRLDLANAQIKQTNASIAKIQSETSDTATDADIEAFAHAALFNRGFLGSIANKPKVLARVQNRVEELETDNVKAVAMQGIANGDTLGETLKTISDSPNIQNKLTAQRTVTKLFNENTQQGAKKFVSNFKSPLVSGVAKFGTGIGTAAQGIENFIFGEEAAKEMFSNPTF